MSTPNAVVRTEDLGRAIGWMEGLVAILQQLGAEGRGRGGASDPLVDALENLIDEYGVWEAVRWIGTRDVWGDLAASAEALCSELTEGYEAAAM